MPRVSAAVTVPGRVVDAGFFNESWQLAAPAAGKTGRHARPAESPVFPAVDFGAAAGERPSIIAR